LGRVLRVILLLWTVECQAWTGIIQFGCSSISDISDQIDENYRSPYRIGGN